MTGWNKQYINERLFFECQFYHKTGNDLEYSTQNIDVFILDIFVSIALGS